jgi:ketosteroid isomerase-like protein
MYTKSILLITFSLLLLRSGAQSRDELAIRHLLAEQTAAWNRGDLDGFMKGYWENDSLVFVGKSGVNYGWKTTLNNYRRGYPDTVAMGKLAFTILQVRKLSGEYYHVIGKWHLQRTIGNLEGSFTLLFRKIHGNWYVIIDHSS